MRGGGVRPPGRGAEPRRRSLSGHDSRVYPRLAVVWVGRIVGAILGFAVGILFSEVIFANDRDWTNVIPFVLAVVGIMAGSALAHRLAKTT